MCGIAGFIGPPQIDAEPPVRAMLDMQVHRGPDAGGVHHLGRANAAVGNRRLAILDTSELGRQPMVNPDTNDVLVYNGEIYNFKELRRTLESHGFSFRSDSDTETLLRALEHWGLDCLKRLQGMFAFAFWQAGTRSLFLVRDPLGIKPLYYTRGLTDRFAFASETRALTSTAVAPDDLDPGGLAGYLAYGSVPEPATIYKHVLALVPGTWLEIGLDAAPKGTGTYWSFPQPDEDEHQKDVHLEGRALLESAVKGHLQSDVPLGIFSSSGLDSTAIVGLAQHVDPGRVRALTVSFPDDLEYDETTLAAAAAERVGASHESFPVDHSTALAWAESGLRSMDQPAADGLNTFVVARAAREHGLTVALSGLGGDEIFGGYPSFRNIPRWSSAMRSTRWVPGRVRAALAGMATAKRDHAATQKARDVASSSPDATDLYLSFRRNLSNGDLAALGIHASDVSLLPSFVADEEILRTTTVAGDPVATVSRLETSFYLRNTLLRDSDVFGMANSLEIRVPFLDTPLVEWAMSLPGSALLPSGRPDKHQLRAMTQEFLLPEQAEQSKRGFVLPLGAWMKGPLKDLVGDSLATLKTNGLVEPAGLDTLRQQLSRSTGPGSSFRLWSLVALGSWIQNRTPATQQARP